MSMSTALSGLKAAQTEISATSHNIANVGTVGFRSSRVEFADVFSSSPMSNQRTAVGSGVQVQRVAQNFSQGNVVTTGNLLDIAIEGQGFFALQPQADSNGSAGGAVFSRAGAFTMDTNGHVVNGANQALLCYPVTTGGVPLTTQINQAVPLTIPMQTGAPSRSTEVNLVLHLPSDDAMLGSQSAVPPAAAFDPADPTTFARRSVVPVYGADGTPVQAEAYFVKTASPDATSTDTTYAMHLVIDGQEVAPTDPAIPSTLTFDGAGELTSGNTLSFGGTEPIAFHFDGSTLTSSPFAVAQASHNGVTPAKLTNLELDGSGSVWATYGTGERIALGQIVLANFSNPQGLKVMGKSTFGITSESGQPLTGTAGTAGFGALRSGALERSNVELTEELVNLISAQRNYQASAKAMETSTSLMQTIMNIRG
ncbi:flagellar hook protein FlgE [Paragemmobacter straminiformis]|uniref:Flagellar hook protein FlgE n=1 Tax=Paragemmobacter straminiformis TaxID=2045119 RepID=A0A842I3L6_9RHOB|nr:flagellar hook protein FlgE [Gemmobacter straminiformis]MBC2834752.1 flagellar hook protein FlgE [Gemmobacter straminiformis]